MVPVVLIGTLALAACGDAPPSSSARGDPESSDLSPSVGSSIATIDPLASDCATDDPAGLGELTGVWSGNDRGVYYIRQIGDCVWWFGTEVRDIELGQTGQRGFANVASGRVDGTEVEVEFADIPLGDILNGGGLTFVYDEGNGTLTLTDQRGRGQTFGGSLLTRIDPDPSPDPSPMALPSP